MMKAFAQVRTSTNRGGVQSTEAATTTSVQGREYQTSGTTAFGGLTSRGTPRRISQTRANAISGRRQVNSNARVARNTRRVSRA